ncbi:MAG: hypothetical protein ACJAS3_002778 [Roseivirga sp.]|jgi:hypothetical protein
MKEFDLSDKEIKSLLKEEGLQEPPMAFNTSILAQIKALDSNKAKPISAPKWLVYLLLSVVTLPAFTILSKFKLTESEIFSELNFSGLQLDMEINSSYFWMSVLVIALIWMAILFDKFVLKRILPLVKFG